MDISVLDIRAVKIALSICFGAAVYYLVYVGRRTLSDAAQEVRAESVKEVDTGLAELYMRLSPEVFLLVRLVAAVVGFIVGIMAGGVIIGIILAVAGAVGPKLALSRMRAKRVKKLERQLVEGLELLGNGLKSGLTLPQAVELLVREFPAPVSQEFALVLAETRLGVEFTQALQNMATRLGSNIVFILAAGVSVTKRCGGDLTVIFTNIAGVIREQANIEGKLDAVTAQGRFQGLILGAMPFVLMVVLYFIDRSHIETLFAYTLGHWAIAAVVVMVTLAQLWIRKLMQIDV